jgi:hypothetical protein
VVFVAVLAVLSELRVVEFAALIRLEENPRGGRRPYFGTGVRRSRPFPAIYRRGRTSVPGCEGEAGA